MSLKCDTVLLNSSFWKRLSVLSIFLICVHKYLNMCWYVDGARYLYIVDCGRCFIHQIDCLYNPSHTVCMQNGWILWKEYPPLFRERNPINAIKYQLDISLEASLNIPHGSFAYIGTMIIQMRQMKCQTSRFMNGQIGH